MLKGNAFKLKIKNEKLKIKNEAAKLEAEAKAKVEETRIAAEKAKAEAEKKAQAEAAKKPQKSAKKAELKAAEEAKKAQEAARARAEKIDAILSDKKNVEKLDKIFKDGEVILQTASPDTTRTNAVYISPEKYFTQFVQDANINEVPTLYHGTSNSAAESILKNGFDTKYCTRMESGRGIYLTSSLNSAKGYASETGGKVIKAELQPGVKVAKLVRPEGILRGAGSPIDDLANAILGNTVSEELNVSYDDALDVITEYTMKRIKKMGYGAIITSSSQAGCEYFCVPDTSLLKIVGTV